MTDQRERTLISGLSFRARPCSGMAPSQSLIDQAKGVCKQDEPNDEDGGTNHIAAYPSHWGMQPVGFADLLVKA
ncbi:MAG: hypothetical protein IT343_00055 [Candidatus Melainabacteria bacterium]|nr:hypothetical protein [Candidatus Melainabacteria bacterium]